MNPIVYEFNVKPEATLRYFSLYIVVATSSGKESKIYSGKTGDNREGCNPVISRCGNHFSYNKAHSQVRNKLREEHTEYEYQFYFTHFQEYKKGEDNRSAINEINELERLLMIKVKARFEFEEKIKILNPFKGKLKKENEKYHKEISMNKVDCLVSRAYDYYMKYPSDKEGNK